MRWVPSKRFSGGECRVSYIRIRTRDVAKNIAMRLLVMVFVVVVCVDFSDGVFEVFDGEQLFDLLLIGIIDDDDPLPSIMSLCFRSFMAEDLLIWLCRSISSRRCRKVSRPPPPPLPPFDEAMFAIGNASSELEPPLLV